MRTAERAALVERLARAKAWSRLTEPQRDELHDEASREVEELVTDHQDHSAIGWMLLDPEEAEA